MTVLEYLDNPEKPRCEECKWVHEADSKRGISYQGVGLCAKHAATDDLLEALQYIAKTSERMAHSQDRDHQFWLERMARDARDAIAKAGVKA